MKHLDSCKCNLIAWCENKKTMIQKATLVYSNTGHAKADNPL